MSEYGEQAVKLSTANENCEDDNWGDWINLCYEADKEIAYLRRELKRQAPYIKDLEAQELKMRTENNALKEKIEDMRMYELKILCHLRFFMDYITEQTKKPALSYGSSSFLGCQMSESLMLGAIEEPELRAEMSDQQKILNARELDRRYPKGE